VEQESLNKTLNSIEEEMDRLEAEFFRHPFHTRHFFHDAYRLRKKLSGCRKAIGEEQGESRRRIEFMAEEIENFANLLYGAAAQRTNEIMRILTVISTIFMPLTFIVGIYGMNFRYIPELQWRLGYPLVMFFMSVLTLLILVWFRKRRWI